VLDVFVIWQNDCEFENKIVIVINIIVINMIMIVINMAVIKWNVDWMTFLTSIEMVFDYNFNSSRKGH